MWLHVAQTSHERNIIQDNKNLYFFIEFSFIDGMPENKTTVRQAQVQNTSVKTNQNPSLEGNNSMDSTNKNQTQGIERSTLSFCY